MKDEDSDPGALCCATGLLSVVPASHAGTAACSCYSTSRFVQWPGKAAEDSPSATQWEMWMKLSPAFDLTQSQAVSVFGE